jgi:DNA-binding MarR family transcriptional regulator
MAACHEQLLAELGSELNTLLAASRAVVAKSAARFHSRLQPAAYQVALILMSSGPLSGGRIAEQLGMDKSAVSRLAKSLADNALIEASPDPEDGRSTVYRLTNEGCERIRAGSQIKADAFFSRVENWSETDLAQFVHLLRRFNTIRDRDEF